MPGQSISRNTASLYILLHDVINLSYHVSRITFLKAERLLFVKKFLLKFASDNRLELVKVGARLLDNPVGFLLLSSDIPLIFYE